MVGATVAVDAIRSSAFECQFCLFGPYAVARTAVVEHVHKRAGVHGHLESDADLVPMLCRADRLDRSAID
eukprot:2732644-Prymnesium_polylepis.1